MSHKIKVLSLFSGAGGLELGLDDRFEVVGFSEVSRNSSSVLRKNYPEISNYGDINKIKVKDLPQFDFLVGGSPCQNLSMAGNRLGLKGKKSSLFYEYLRILKEANPSYFLWENVKGTLSSNGGKDFIEVLKKFSSLGYNLQWQVLNCKDFGSAQSRNRIFVFGSKNLQQLPGLLSIQRQDYRTSKLKLKQFCGNLVKEGYVNTITASYGVKSGDGSKVCSFDPTLENLKKFRNNEIDGFIRPLSPLECERLMGWPEGYTRVGIDKRGNHKILSNNARYKICGNGIAPKCVEALLQNFGNKKMFSVCNDKKMSFKVSDGSKTSRVFSINNITSDHSKVVAPKEGVLSKKGHLLVDEKPIIHQSTYGKVLLSQFLEERTSDLSASDIEYLFERVS
ncbi:MAG: DNA cytosine methyltransferase [Pseudobdellovibrionaceae bacterium]|nr:DNA cytosine methyltransferase [Bdellovibrionales bacterium]USN48600.1 MAG: DNA cytosine methyltransferase [Pseudobdellovibrionaceae bacterium]